ncbi:hypothetical protein IJ579_01000, partial [bacterium]|nr:hypothetical protein [bacterium]
MEIKASKGGRVSGSRSAGSFYEIPDITGVNDFCHSEQFGMTEEFPSPLVGEGLGVRGVPARGKHTSTKTFPSL